MSLVTTPSPASVNANILEDEISVDGPPAKKRVHGLTTNKLVAKLIPDEQIDMELDPQMRALGWNISEFANFIGPLVRCAKFVPVQVDGWSFVNEKSKNGFLTEFV